MLKELVILSCLVLSPIAFGAPSQPDHPQQQEGTLTLVDFLDASEAVANTKPSRLVPQGIPGSVVSIKGVPYEIRFFSFEDTLGKVAPETTFRDYATKNKMLGMKSTAATLLDKIKFEMFDYKRKPLNDGVYFSMALRKVEKD